MGAPYIVLGPITTNSTDASGVQWVQGEIKGMGSPQGTLAPVQKPRQPGAWAGLSYAKGRSFVVNGTTIAPSPTLAQQALDVLNGAASLDQTLLTYVTDAGPRWTMTRRDGEVIPTWLNSSSFTWSVQFFSADPRMFGTQLSGSTFLPASSGGLAYPFSVPFSYSSVVTSGIVVLTNAGNATGSVALRIDGPATAPTVTHFGAGEPTTFSTSQSILSAGGWITVDMEKHTVLENDQASRNSYITSRQWSGFDPGVNIWVLNSAFFNSATKLTVTATTAFA
jgi:hypothetical protein